MNLSLNWLKQYVDLPADLKPEALARKLTLSTVEVENFRNLAENLEGIVVGELLSIKKHPNADKLNIALVDVGEVKPRPIVFGQMVEMKVGYKVPVALAPTVLPGGHKIEKAKLRGEWSEGMLCLDQELGLAKEGVSIQFFEKEIKNGSLVKKVLQLDDIVYEIDNKALTNRPDLWGHQGLAREVGALLSRPFKESLASKIKRGKGVALKVKVAEPKLCPRYLGVALSGIKVEPSPVWLRQRLAAIGQSSINNIVDITNYILYDLGQPLHAFDAEKIKNQEITVRRAKKGEQLVALDGQSRVLTAEDLVIADATKAVALAGIMGNENSEIRPSTQTIILEAANFEPFGIRRTANRLNLRTESAIRFEKGLDPNLAEKAMRKAVQLILQTVPGAQVASVLVDINNFSLKLAPIELTWDFIERKIGQKLDPKQIAAILEGLGFKLKNSARGLKVIVPSWRAGKDISSPEDIIEEIVRIYGYDKLEARMPLVRMEYVPPEKVLLLGRQIKTILSEALAANEVYNYSFVDSNFLQKIGQPVTDDIRLANPLAESVSLLRKSLIPNLLKNTVDNLRFYDRINFFEVGQVFIDNQKGEKVQLGHSESLPQQDVMAGGVIVTKNGAEPFFLAKGTVETLAVKLDLKLDYDQFSEVPAWCHPAQTLTILIGKERVGYVASLHPFVAQALDLKAGVGLWELNLNKLEKYFPAIVQYQALGKFPAIKMDLSIIIPAAAAWKDIQNLVRLVEPKLIKQIEFLGVFRDDKIGESRKSLSFRITYAAEDRTLEMSEVDQLQTKILEHLKKAMLVELRQ